MCPSQAKIISYPTDKPEKNDDVSKAAARPEQDFLDKLSQDPAEVDRIRAGVTACLAEIALARDRNDWQSIVDLFYPLEEKQPELVALGLESPIRAELAFALSHTQSMEQSVEEYEKCVKSQPDNFFFVSGLAFAHYNLVYSSKNRERIIPAAQKARHIEDAHKYFALAQMLRPDGVTNYYRQGMLYKNIQNMDLKAAPLFRKALENWEAYDGAMKEKRHQEHKNYVKSLYNLASCLLKQNRVKDALMFLEKCLEQDRQKDFVKPEHKYFALGKIHFELQEYEKTINDLEFAAGFTDFRNGDYIHELWARVLLAMNRPLDALQIIGRIPEKSRRQFVRWTEGECYQALQDYPKARNTWIKSLEKDRRSRHKALIRLARMEFRLDDYDQSFKHALAADEFHRDTYGTPDPEGLFWSTAANIRLGDRQKSGHYLTELKASKPDHPLLGKLEGLYHKTFE